MEGIANDGEERFNAIVPQDGDGDIEEKFNIITLLSFQ